MLVTAQLICVFVFEYAKIWFSHNEAHIIAIDLIRCMLVVINEGYFLLKNLGCGCSLELH